MSSFEEKVDARVDEIFAQIRDNLDWKKNNWSSMVSVAGYRLTSARHRLDEDTKARYSEQDGEKAATDAVRRLAEREVKRGRYERYPGNAAEGLLHDEILRESKAQKELNRREESKKKGRIFGLFGRS